MSTKACEHCGQRFLPSLSHPRQRFHSKRCGHALWVKVNRQRARGYRKKWNAANPANPSKMREAGRRRYAKNPLKFRERRRRTRSELADCYVTQMLGAGTILRKGDFPPAVVEAKRQQIRLRRAIIKINKEDRITV